MIRPVPQRGYILLPVIVVITLVAAIALLMTTESALESNTAATELDARQAQYVATAGLNHALWMTQRQGCGPYNNITNWALGNDQYSTSLTTDLGSTTAYAVTVDQDSWIRDDFPANNYAVDDKLHIRNEGGVTERPLYRYDLSAIPAKGTILSAVARFYVSKAHAEGPVDIHRVTADWIETDATWDSINAAIDKAVLASIPAQPAAGVWVSVNLTSQVQAWVNGAPNFGITLNTASAGVHGDYASRESATAPYLEVVVGAPPSSPALLKSVGQLANGVTYTIIDDKVQLVQQPAGFSQARLTAGSGQDAMLDSFYNNRDYGVHELEVSLGSGSTVEHSVLQFELPAIAPGTRIISAQLELYHNVTTRSTGTPVVDVYRVTRGWIEGSHDGTGTADGATWETWDGSSNWTSAGGDYATASVASSEVSPATGDWESWEIAALVQGWTDRRYSNHGLLLKGTGDFDLSFASREDADPALHPKLSITYACACGEVCVAPQGSGKILMVVISPITLVDEDQKARDLFESWGYTVKPIAASANQSTFDAEFAAHDVVFISETVTSGTLAGKLVGAPIGVVSQDGDYNPDLGLASGSTVKVGAEIDVTDTDHYITRVFAAGPLPIYAADMEQLIVSSAPTAGQQVLADIGGDASLVTLEKGDAMEGGGNAAGRRVMLPLGTRYRFDWDHLNANGRLLVQRALEWGVGKDQVSTGNLLLVVEDPANLLVQESAKKTLFESWGYAVNLIDESDSQANFDSAVAANDVVYITEDVQSGNVNTKLVDATIGVVTEEDNLSDEFGFSDSIHWGSGTALQINNNHYITQPLPEGMVAVFTTLESLADLTGNRAPDLQVLGDAIDGPALATLDTGDSLILGSTAAGRRVILPWGGDNFDVNHLNDDGLTILRRSLEWAAGASLLKEPIAHWKLDETTGLAAVDSINGYDGTLANGPQWQAGLLQGGLGFDGIDDTVDIGPRPALDNLAGGKVTLTAWIYATGWGEGSYGRIVDKSNATIPGAGWEFEVTGPGQKLTLQAAFSAGRGSWSTPDGSISLDTWHHVALVYDGSSDANDPEIYIDGVAQVVTASSNPSGSYVSDAAYDFTIGNHAQSAVRTFDGTLDDIRLFDRLLSAAEIAELAIPPGPIAHWKLDETTGPTAVDSEGGHDGTWTNGPVAAPGVDAGGLDFDGSNDYVDVGGFDVTGSGITMMAWFNAEALTTADERIISKAVGTAEADAWWQLSSNNSGADRFLRMRIKAAGTTTTLADSSVNLATGTWYLATATYDNASGEMKLYLDGVEVASRAHAVGGALDTNPAVPVALGANGTAERFFNGVLDDVRVYNRALGASEIADIYAANPPPGAADYTETYQPWSATSASAWETVDLAPFSVPANAVVEVAVLNADAGKQQWGGVRAVGSALERRVLLHEPESGGIDAVTMHVQADAGGRIQHYSSKTGDVTFALLGYWTGAGYAELFEPFTANAVDTWVEEGVDDEGVGANQVAEILMMNNNGGAELFAGVRASGTAHQRRFLLHEAESGGVDALTLMVAADASSIIEVYTGDGADIEFYVLGTWSTPPGTYTGTGGSYGQVSTPMNWETIDLGGFGVPADSVTQFVLANENTSTENGMRVRAVGSTLNNRGLDLHEAESGGSDLGSLHVSVDGSARVQWAAEQGSTGGFFYPVGWWVLNP